MDSRAWQATVHGVTELAMTEVTSFHFIFSLIQEYLQTPPPFPKLLDIAATEIQESYLWQEAELSPPTTSYLHPFLHNTGHTSIQISKRILAHSFARGKKGAHVTWSKLGQGLGLKKDLLKHILLLPHVMTKLLFSLIRTLSRTQELNGFLSLYWATKVVLNSMG